MNVVHSKGDDPLLLFLGLLFLSMGLIQLIKPSWGWYINEGWKVEGESEPSEAYLIIAQLGGIFGIVVGVILCLAGIFN
ncbi:DUF6199 family natural product biosynthesis protein [Paenibacillus sp. SN-8-1]|uniref:DUF6199 family natural product biosynthesis protein n=1 Tax=Paenibacillus sp. SN-8-1 TaxID=3435409 RepID=UPI003D9A365D